MSYRYYNSNPLSLQVGDCTIEEMVDELRKMKNEVSDMKIKQAISDCISRMEKDN